METDRYHTQREVESAKMLRMVSRILRESEFMKQKQYELLIYGRMSYTSEDLKSVLYDAK